MNNKKWISIGAVVFLLVLAIIFGIVQSSKNSESNGKDSETNNFKKEPIAYEILDDSVQLNKDVDKWLDNNMKKEGFYTKKTKKEVFVLISGGVKKTTGYGISLNAVKQKNNHVDVEYEIVEPSKNEEVENKETNPHMILRFASKDVQVDGNITPLKKEKNQK